MNSNKQYSDSTRKSLKRINSGLLVIVLVVLVLVCTLLVSSYTFLNRLGSGAVDVHTWVKRGAATYAGEVMHVMVATRDATAAFTIFEGDDAEISDRIDFAEGTLKLIFTPNSMVGEVVGGYPSAREAKRTSVRYLAVARKYLEEKPRTDATREELREAYLLCSQAMQKLRLELIDSESDLRDTMIAAVSAGQTIASLAIPAILCALIVLVTTLFVIRSSASKWAMAEVERTRHVGRLMASISYDFRSPLQAIMSAACSLAARPHGRRESDRHMEVITQSANRLKRLVDDLYALSRRGTIDVLSEPVRLSECVQQAVVTYRALAEQKGLLFELKSQLTENLTVVYDEARLTQVISSLLENAIRYTSSGFIRLTVTWSAKQRDPSGLLIFTVEDSGVGVTKENKKWIWDPLAYSGGVDENDDIIGLGFAIVSEIVKSAGGSVAATATQGQGSRLDVVIPLELVKGQGGHQLREPIGLGGNGELGTSPTILTTQEAPLTVVSGDESQKSGLRQVRSPSEV